MARRRKQVTWSVPKEERVSMQIKSIPYSRNDYSLPSDPEERERTLAKLKVGSLWFSCHPLAAETLGRNNRLNPYRYLSTCLRNVGCDFPWGTPAIYMGTTKVEERSLQDNIYTYERHTFLIGGSLYLTTRLTEQFSPADNGDN